MYLLYTNVLAYRSTHTIPARSTKNTWFTLHCQFTSRMHSTDACSTDYNILYSKLNVIGSDDSFSKATTCHSCHAEMYSFNELYL